MTRSLDPKFRAALSLLQLQELEQVEAVCVGCGCDDLHACTDKNGRPCSWSYVDVHSGRGICSVCLELPIDQLLAKAEEREKRPQLFRGRMTA